MKTLACALLAASVVGVMAPAGGGSAQETLDFEGRSWLSTSPDTRVETHLGRQALVLRNGGVFLPDLEFQDGVIEYDVSTTGHRSFVGAAFRVRQSPRVEYEHFYLRPHQTGRFDAVQYTPEINGLSAWQLFSEFNAPVAVPAGEWIHVRLEIEGGRLAAWVGDAPDPVLVVDHLRLEPGPGMVGLTSNFPEAGELELYPTAFSNISVTVSESAAAPSDHGALEPAAALALDEAGFITEWALSESHPGPAGNLTSLPAAALDEQVWETLPVDSRGRLHIAEHRSFVEGVPGAHVYARVLIDSDEARTRALNFGFSDVGRIFLNGKLLFTGNNTYRSRSLRYLGAMTVDNDAIYLPLVAGTNELVFVVSESFGGWGLVARLPERDGITVRSAGGSGA